MVQRKWVGAILDVGKEGLTHITRKRTADNPSVLLPDGSRLEAVGAKETLRLLALRQKNIVQSTCSGSLLEAHPRLLME
jgi:hypothetical protein